MAVIAVSDGGARRSALPVTDIGQAGATSVKVAGDWLAAGEGGIWLSDPPGKVIRRLDPGSGALTATIRVPQEPCEATDVAFGALWTATCGSPGLARIDPKSNKVSGFVALPLSGELLAGEGSVGAGAGGVWLVIDGPKCLACRVARVNPKSLRIVARVPVRKYSASVRTGYGAVWVTNPDANLVQKINPRTNRVVATTKVGLKPRFFDVGEGGVWTLNQRDGSVTRLDPQTAKVVARIDAGVFGEGGDMTVGGGWVWPRGANALLTRIDPRTNAVAERYGPQSGSGADIVCYDAVWVSAHDVTTVWRLPLPSP